MGLTQTEQALLIILSTFLAIFLLLGILVLSYMLKISKKVNIIVDKAEKMTERAEAISEMFEKSSPSMAVMRIIGNVAEMLKKRSNKE